MIYLLIPVLIFLLGLLGLLLLYVYVQNSRLAKLINKIPGPPTIPILGNLLMFHKTLEMRFTQFVRPKQTQEANLQNAKVKKRKVNRIEKKYNADMMIQALDAIGCGQSLREVSHRFQIPKSTIHDKLKQYSPINCKKGPPTVLNETVENNIVDWIIYCSERGFPITKIQLLECVQKYVSDKKIKTPFVNNRPGKEWYNAFMKRHKGRLSLRIAQNLTSMRASVTEEDLRNWFVHTKTYLEKNDLINLEMDRVFNLDETAFMLVPKDNSVLCKKGSRSVYQIIGSSEKANLTVLFTAIASGLVLPPMILYDLKTAPKKNILSRIPTGWGVGHTERGWMTSESFYSYITNVFFKWLNDNNYKFPIILYVDGHSSHLTLPLCRFCKEHQIELIALHPNSTHVLQPLDVAFFHPLKEQYKKTLRKWRIENNILDFKKYMFAEVLKLVIEQNDFSSSIQNGFRVCGLYPFDPNAVNYNILNKAKKKKSSADSVLRNKSNNNYRDTFNLLQILETKFISPDLLNNFEENEFVHWQGDISQKGLFEVWCKIRRLCDVTTSGCDNNISIVNNVVTSTKNSSPILKDRSYISNENINLIVIENLLEESTDLSAGESTNLIEISNSKTYEEINSKDCFHLSKNIDNDCLNLPSQEVEFYNESGERIVATMLTELNEYNSKPVESKMYTISKNKVITDSIENIIVDSAIDVENSLIPEDINEVNKNENLLNSSENCNLNSEDFTGYQEHVLDLSKKNYNSRNHFLKADVDENVSVDYIIDSTKDTTEVINVEHNQNHLEHNQDKIFQRKIENLDLHGLITSNIININNNYCDTHNKLVFKASDSYKSSQNVDLSIMPKIPEISSQRDISSVINVLDEISCDPMDSGLGNKFLNLKVQVHQTLLELACSYYPICRIWMCTVPLVIILHPDDIQIILASTKHIDKKYGYEHFRPWLKSGLLISTGQKWQTRRKILTPSFHFNVLQKYMDITMEQSEREIIKMRSKGKEVTEDLLPFCSNLTLNIICEAAMGVTLESEKDESAKKYKSAVYNMGTMIVYRILRPYLRDWMIPLMPKFHKEIKEIIHDLDSFTINVIQERRAYHKNNNDKKLKHLDSNDDLETSNIYFGKRRLAMLDLLLAAENDGLIDEEGIIAEVATFIFEGHDTSAMALCFGLLLFAENKESQNLARQEVEEILSRTNGKVTTASLLEMNYLERCIKEMIRLYPSVPSITRSLQEDLKLKNCIIPKGSEIFVHIEHVHRNPEFWPEPTKFNPDRFLKDEIRKRHPFSYVPFSGGPRNCIGQKFAMLELKSLLAHILYNFYLKPVTNTRDIKIQTDIILRPSEPVYTKFIRIDR